MNDILNTKLVEQLIEYHTGPAYLKDVTSDKFLLSNQQVFSMLNVKKKDLLSKTIADLKEIINPSMLNNLAQEQKFEEKIIQNNKPIKTKNNLWLNAAGYVCLYDMIKFPVLNQHNKIFAILTLYQDLTANISLWDLYQNYCISYEDKAERVNKFLEHIQIINYFNELPTHCELLVLILKEAKYSNKEIATKINVQPSTIETHINKLNQKINDFHRVIKIMSQWRMIGDLS